MRTKMKIIMQEMSELFIGVCNVKKQRHVATQQRCNDVIILAILLITILFIHLHFTLGAARGCLAVTTFTFFWSCFLHRGQKSIISEWLPVPAPIRFVDGDTLQKDG